MKTALRLLGFVLSTATTAFLVWAADSATNSWLMAGLSFLSLAKFLDTALRGVGYTILSVRPDEKVVKVKR